MKKLTSLSVFALAIFIMIASARPALAQKEKDAPEDYYRDLMLEVEKIKSVDIQVLLIEVDLTNQVLRVIQRGGEDREKVISVFNCTTGPGKYGQAYSKGSSDVARTTLIVATGRESEDGLRTSQEAGGVGMPHFLELGFKDSNGNSRGIGIHAGVGEHVSRVPATMGCIRIPTSAARELYKKVRGDKERGKVAKLVPVRFTGETPDIW